MYSHNDFNWPPPPPHPSTSSFSNQGQYYYHHHPSSVNVGNVGGSRSGTLKASPCLLSLPPSLPLLLPYSARASTTATSSKAILNWPEEYDSHASENGSLLSFSHPIPHIIGNEKYFMLLDPIILQLNSGNTLQCYTSHRSTIGIWSMKKEDIIKINSILFDMTRVKQLYGEVKYLNVHGQQQHFSIDAFSAFFSNSGRRVSFKSSSIVKGMIQDLEAFISLKISGIVQNVYTNIIECIISIHEFQVVRRDKRNNIPPSLIANAGTLEDKKEAEEVEERYSTPMKMGTFV